MTIKYLAGNRIRGLSSDRTTSFTETNVTGLQYVGIKNYLVSTNGALNGTLDDLEIYNGVTSIT